MCRDKSRTWFGLGSVSTISLDGKLRSSGMVGCKDFSSALTHWRSIANPALVLTCCFGTTLAGFVLVMSSISSCSSCIRFLLVISGMFMVGSSGLGLVVSSMKRPHPRYSRCLAHMLSISE